MSSLSERAHEALRTAEWAMNAAEAAHTDAGKANALADEILRDLAS